VCRAARGSSRFDGQLGDPNAILRAKASGRSFSSAIRKALASRMPRSGRKLNSRTSTRRYRLTKAKAPGRALVTGPVKQGRHCTLGGVRGRGALFSGHTEWLARNLDGRKAQRDVFSRRGSW